MSYADAGPVPRRCPCGCYPEIVEEGARVQVSCSCCGRKTFWHERAAAMSPRSRAINVWNELIRQHEEDGRPWPGRGV